jgi:Na+-transporting NADH:ubiquinone oxidoreductase subunit NqrC
VETMTTSTFIIVAVISGTMAILGSSVPVFLNNRAQRAARLEDWARQDQVAARVEAVAEKAAEVGDQVANRVEAVASKAAEVAAANTSRLDQIHTLVNSNLTAALQRELDATVVMQVALREVVALKRERGLEPDPESLAVLEDTRRRIEQLTRELEYKVKQTEAAAEQRKQASG